MEAFLIYLLKSAAFLSVFYVIYISFLKNETSFSENRKFLAAGILASIILPSFYFTKTVIIQETSTKEYLAWEEDLVTQTSAESFTIWEIFGWIYLIVAIALLLRFLFQLYSVFQFIQKEKKQREGRFVFIKTNADINPFSFFKFIIFNPQKHPEKELNLILHHEKIHARQYHSVDILLANLITAVLWFNPLSWAYRKSLQENLEFIADEATVDQAGEKETYQKVLLRVSVANLQPKLTNQFYHSLIKKRILMLNKNKQSKFTFLKMSFVFPLILAFLLSFNVKTEARVIPSENKISISNSSKQDQKLVEAHFSEITSKTDLETYKNSFAEKNVQLKWRDIKYSGNKLKNIHVTYTLESGDTREFQSKTDEDGTLIPFKIRAQFRENGKIAFISIANKKSEESVERKLVEKEVTRTHKELPEDIIFKLDGKVVDKKVVEALAPESIAKMQVLKGDKAVEELGREAKDGVILITTKDSKTSPQPNKKDSSPAKKTSKAPKTTKHQKL